MWDLSRPDWEDRIRNGQSLIPADLPLNESEAAMGLAFFDALPLPDGLDEMTLGEAAGDWFRDLVRVIFGSWDPATRLRAIRDFFVLAPKGSSKTTYSAGLMLSVMLMNKRQNAEALFIGPTQSVSDRAYDQAAAMVRRSADLQRRFDAQDYHKTIVDKVNGSEMKVKTFSLEVLTGSFPIFVLLDEIHLLGRNPHTAKVLTQIRGGVDKREEGLLLVTTTQSDDIPAGAFKDELHMARKIRDGEFKNKIVRSMLPIIYEFPRAIAKDRDRWSDQANWPMVIPNLGRSVHLRDLVPTWETEKLKGEKAVRVWVSQHLNIEVGIGLKTEAWPGAEFWDSAVDETLTLETLIERSEAIVVGADGGGLDDLFGLCVLGREPAIHEVKIVSDGKEITIKIKRWLAWSFAWCHKSTLERRQSIAAALQGFHEANEIRIIDRKLEDIAEMVAIIARVNDAGKLACVALDPEGPYGDLVDALDELGINEESEQVVGIGQGYKLMNAIKTTERRLDSGMLVHAPSKMMDWCVGNVKIEPTATALRPTKQNAGDAKIDPWCALQDAASVMVRNPEPKSGSRSYLETEELIVI